MMNRAVLHWRGRSKEDALEELMSSDIPNPSGSGPGSSPGVGRVRRYRYSDSPAPAAAVAVAGPQVPGGGQFPGLPLEWDRITWALLAAGICFVALYYSEIMALTNVWYSDISWSHGFVVPLISVFFIWNKW